MSILTVTGLTHIFENKTLFENGELLINNGEHCGIVGLNGAGKTTFMNIISGKILQDFGEIKWLNNTAWGYLDQHANIDRTLTVMEYLEGSFKELFDLNARLEKLYEDMSLEDDMDKMNEMVERSAKMFDKLSLENFFEIESEIKKVANGLGVNAFGYDTPIKNLSGGQRAKLMLAKLLLSDLNVLLLDEPTNFLDLEHIEWLAKYLDSFKGAFLLISHDTSFLNKVCKVIVNIENQQIKKYNGNYDTFMEQRENNARQYEDNYVRQQREIKKMEEYIAKNGARASTAGMANSRKKMLEKIDVMAKPTTIYPATFTFPYSELVAKDMVVLNKLEIGYKKPLLPQIDMHLNSESKIWIRGTNGIGKSTLLKTLLGIIPKLGGEFNIHSFAKIGYLEQDLEFANNTINPLIYINELFPRKNVKELRSELAKVGIKNELASKPIYQMSGGEQVRVKLCAICQIMSNILILDEPTNHLDVVAKEALKEALINYKGAIILVSHEPEFAASVCTDVFDVVN